MNSHARSESGDTSSAAPQPRFLRWEQSAVEICDQIRRKHTTLKILLKTKNERDFLKQWVDHHAAIAGIEGLVIFDNDSTDSDVIALLQSIENEATVAQFGGFHNDFHRFMKFGPLYEAVRASSDYFIVLDTDEFMCWVDESCRALPQSAIADAIRRLPPQEIVIGSWVNNRDGDAERFVLFQGDGRYPLGLGSGKSLISSTCTLRGTLCHNFQLEGPNFGGALSGNLLVLHMKALLPRQRIRANLEKLRQYKFLSASDGLEKVLSAEWETRPKGNVRQWIKEIQHWNQASIRLIDAPTEITAGQVIIRHGEPVVFFSEENKARFMAYMASPGLALKEALEHRALPKQ